MVRRFKPVVSKTPYKIAAKRRDWILAIELVGVRLTVISHRAWSRQVGNGLVTNLTQNAQLEKTQQ